MFRPTQDCQMNLNDRYFTASRQAKTAVDCSRAKLVGDIIYPNVDESKFASMYSDVFSRPNIEIRRYVSALILKRLYRLSDELLIEFLRCGALNFQYALHTTQDEQQPLSESSLRRFRRKIEEYNKEHQTDIIKYEFERISKILAVEMGVLVEDPNSNDDDTRPILVRMDSMEIEAHAKAMTRVEILYMTNLIVIRYLLKKDFKNIIPEELNHYLEDGDHNKVMYYRVSDDKKAGIQDTRVNETIKEMELLQQALRNNFSESFLNDVPEYTTFIRVLEEQTKIDENGVRIAKDKTEISANSVQNPFDTTVTYRYKRGHHHGHVLNVAEVHDGQGNGIIVHAVVEPNTQSDQNMAKAYMEQQPDNGHKQIFTADGAYNGDDVERLAEEKNIDIQTTSLTGKMPNDIFADFVLNAEQTAVLTCPMGFEPTSCDYKPNNGHIMAKMPNNCCATCPHKEECRARVNNKKSVSRVQINGKTVARARQARNFSSEEGKLNACRRNGVEGIMSVMRRKYDVDHIPVFGIDRLKTWIWTTLLSYNLVKYQKYNLALKKQAIPN